MVRARGWGRLPRYAVFLTRQDYRPHELPAWLPAQTLPRTVVVRIPPWIGTGSQGSISSSGVLGCWWCSERESQFSSGVWLLGSMLWCVALSCTHVQMGSTNSEG